MSYVDAMLDRKAGIVKVVERDRDGKRIFKEFPVNYTFYYSDPKGKFKSIYGDSLSREVCKSITDQKKALNVYSHKKIFESDLNQVQVCLSDNYLNKDGPNLHIAWFDIETDFSPERGFATPDDAFMPITAISVYLQWMETMVTVAIPPKSLTVEQAQELVTEFPNTFICSSEKEMLDMFLNIIEDADVLSGWNSTGYDIPYTINRITQVMSKDDTRRLCLWDQFPKKRDFEKYGKITSTYDLVGRVHMDSLDVYRKFTFEERQSYRLDAIGEMEVGERKTIYEGSLDQLYNNDFRKFIEYNRQDTALLDKIDKKLKFISLANNLAHMNTVLLPATLATVAMVDQAIVNECHRLGMQVPNRVEHDEEATKAAGAYVAYPKTGMHNDIGSVDINSLYPSVIRALNMGPETIVGQLRADKTNKMLQRKLAEGSSFADAWENVFAVLEYDDVMSNNPGIMVTIDWQDGTSSELSSAQAYKLIFDSNAPYMLSANGTIFSYEREGIIPGLLKKWYAERKEMQAKVVAAKDAKNAIDEDFWDRRQMTRKILLNSLYGALLNVGCRFFDKRIGQSTTLTGRAIDRHMAAVINETITGKYDHVGDAIIYCDSVTGDTNILTEQGDVTIEDLFNSCSDISIIGEKEYGIRTNHKVLGYNSYENEPVISAVSYVMRHKTKKKIYKITLNDGKTIKVTEDHSIMVDRDGFLIEVKPTEILDTDLMLIYARDTGSVDRTTMKAVDSLGEIDDYVYDISIDDQDPFFFANDILVHNTDSAYFSAYPILKKEIESGQIPWTRDDVIKLYDSIAVEVNESFVPFMRQAFHCPKVRGEVIRAGREIVGSKALFITKKRYAVMYYDKDGRRYDKEGKDGKIKAMGLDLRRADTPEYVQKFLLTLLEKVLTTHDRVEIFEMIKEFRKKFKEVTPWEKGTPKRANNITKYKGKIDDLGKTTVPGHVRACINWNTLKQMNHDNYAMPITDGAKVIVCYLKNNPMKFKSIAYPIDELRLPQWFKDLPFDEPLMEKTIIDNKLDNLLGILGWDLNETKSINTFQNLFDF